MSQSLLFFVKSLYCVERFLIEAFPRFHMEAFPFTNYDEITELFGMLRKEKSIFQAICSHIFFSRLTLDYFGHFTRSHDTSFNMHIQSYINFFHTYLFTFYILIVVFWPVSVIIFPPTIWYQFMDLFSLLA